MSPARDLIATAEAVVSLWDPVLFASGTAPARQKRTDVLHEAVLNLRGAIANAKEESP